MSAEKKFVDPIAPVWVRCEKHFFNISENLSFEKNGQPSIVSYQSLSASQQRSEAVTSPDAKKPKLSSSSSPLDLMIKREEHNLKMDEIRQRMEHEQELFQLRKEKIENDLERDRVQLDRERLQLEREKVQLQISRHQLAKLTGDVVEEVVFTSS